MIEAQEDEVLFAIAEELGKCFVYHPEKTLFMESLEKLAKHDETVVREEAAKSLIKICTALSDADIQNVFAPMVIKLAQNENFVGRVSCCPHFKACYYKSGPQ